MNQIDERVPGRTELRQEAEQLIQKKPNLVQKYRVPPSQDGSAKILQELQVHQIELELQNEELRRAQAELQASRDQYFDLYELAPVGYLTLNENGIIHAINLTGADLLGSPKAKFLNHALTQFIAEPCHNQLYYFYQKCRNTLNPQSCELQLCCSEKEPKWVQLNGGVMGGSAGTTQLRVSVIDITIRKELERQLRQSQKMDAIGTLASGIAHEFNNLLVPILGLTQNVQNQFSPHSLESEQLGGILDAATRAKTLVSQVLAFSRKTHLQLKSIVLDELIAETLPFIRSTLPETLSIQQNLSIDCPSIFADAAQIHQVIVNLAINASHAMPNGGKLTIGSESAGLRCFTNTQQQKMEGEFVCLSVRDTGCGMDADTMEKVFEPFFTTKSAQQGTGLGLAVVLGMIEQHGGHIEVTSQPGVGTEFKVYFPVIDVQS